MERKRPSVCERTLDWFLVLHYAGVLPHLLSPDSDLPGNGRYATTGFGAYALDCLGDLTLSARVWISLLLLDIEILRVFTHDDQIDR